ncbi:hypothetical protein ACFL3I_06785, partial [Pseudomonadota bacterium]
MNTYNKRTQDEDEDKRIVPDGGSVRVSMMAMDSVQKQVATIDERVQHNIEAGKATLAAAQRDADQVQAHVDHFTAEREAQTDTSAYGQHCQRISEAWQ